MINFAYGSNMYRPQMEERCPGAVVAGVGRVPGYRFRINSCGVATIVPEEGALIFGVLWELNEENEKRLDGFEGVRNGIYRKETLTVNLLEGGDVRAVAYIAKITEPGPPRAGYLEKILMGAEDFGLPEEYLKEVCSWES